MPQTSESSSPFVRPKSETQLSVPLDLIDDNPWQPRQTYDAAKLEELISSIRADGLLQPVAVRRASGGRYQLVAGHRRLRAFKELLNQSDANEERRFSSIPALLKANASDEEMARMALNENLQRDDLLPTEAAAALASYRDMTGLKTSKELAKAMGLNENRVKRLLRLNDAPRFIKAAVSEGLVLEADGKRVRRKLDLMGALEFGLMYRVLFARDSKRAEAKVRSAIDKALHGDWGFRRIEAFVEDQVSERAEPHPQPVTTDEPIVEPALQMSGTRMLLDTARLDELNEHQRAQVRVAVQALFVRGQ